MSTVGNYISGLYNKPTVEERAIYYRKDHEILTKRDLQISAIMQSCLFVAQHSGDIYFLVTAPQLFLGSIASGVCLALALGIIKGIGYKTLHPDNPCYSAFKFCEDISQDWYEFLTKQAPKKPEHRSFIPNVIGSCLVNAVLCKYLITPRLAGLGLGSRISFYLGQHLVVKVCNVVVKVQNAVESRVFFLPTVNYF